MNPGFFKQVQVLLDPDVLVYCGYIGGRDWDEAHGIALDFGGNAYIAGDTSSNQTTENFPVAVGPDLTYHDGQDAFVAKIAGGTTSSILPVLNLLFDD